MSKIIESLSVCIDQLDNKYDLDVAIEALVYMIKLDAPTTDWEISLKNKNRIIKLCGIIYKNSII